MSDLEQLVRSLVTAAFADERTGGGSAPEIAALSDANRGRGVFSRVVRAELTWSAPGTGPSSVVVKVNASGENGRVAVASGACAREALAYRRVLPSSPVASPHAYLVRSGPGGEASFVLEDLGRHRLVDQLAGLTESEAAAVAASLSRFHRHWAHHPGLDALPVRRSTPSTLDPNAIAAGLGALEQRWAGIVDDAALAEFRALVENLAAVVDAFDSAGEATLCHGDPRADNLAFAEDGTPVLYDWQQLAVQMGAADLSWLAATSLTPSTRRRVERDLVADSGTTFDRYRTGLALPGLAVLLLARRETPDDRSRRFVATSLSRIGAAIVEHEVARIAGPGGT